jgi:hypothetical protein
MRWRNLLGCQEPGGLGLITTEDEPLTKIAKHYSIQTLIPHNMVKLAPSTTPKVRDSAIEAHSFKRNRVF